MRCDANSKHWFTTYFFLSARKRCSVSAVSEDAMAWPGLRSLALASSPSMETSDHDYVTSERLKTPELNQNRVPAAAGTVATLTMLKNLKLRLRLQWTERQRTTVRLLRDRTTKAALFRVARALTTPQSRLKDTARRF